MTKLAMVTGKPLETTKQELKNTKKQLEVLLKEQHNLAKEINIAAKGVKNLENKYDKKNETKIGKSNKP